MRHTIFSTFLAISFILLSVLLDTQALKCWVCDRDDSMCKDPFASKTRNIQFQNKYYQECPEPLGKDYVAVCKKLKIWDVDKKYLVRRTCESEERNETECIHNFVSDRYTEFKYCGTCRTDGCNKNTRNVPFILLIASTSVLTAFFFSFTS